jgi:hypothetical protein
MNTSLRPEPRRDRRARLAAALHGEERDGVGATKDNLAFLDQGETDQMHSSQGLPRHSNSENFRNFSHHLHDLLVSEGQSAARGTRQNEQPMEALSGMRGNVGSAIFLSKRAQRSIVGKYWESGRDPDTASLPSACEHLHLS